MNRDQLATRLRATFVAELEDQVRALNVDLLALERLPDDAERLKSLFRVAHTLKGAARAASVPLVELVCHALETMLAKARDGKLTLGPDHFALLFSAADALRDAGARLRDGQDLGESPLASLAEALARSAPSGTQRAGPAQPASRSAVPAPEPGDEQVRVQAEKLDDLLASSVQLLALSSRTGARGTALQSLRDAAARHAADWERTGRRLRLVLERSGAPPSATQEINRLQADLRQLAQDATHLAAAAARDGRVFSQVTDDLLYQARRLRMRPFADGCEALPRTVRDLATAAGKEADLVITGGEVEADRAVLDGLREVLLHLVRNAVDHGIEMPAARERAGKARRGTITVAAALTGDRLVVTVADDGAGLNLPGVRAQLEQKGLPAPTDPQELIRMLLRGGISTRGQVTAVSGRGVGLDLVRAAVERLSGSLNVVWQEGRGTTFVVECATTLATVRAVLVSVGPQVLALPTTHVERLIRVRPEDIRRAEGRDVVPGTAGPVPLVSLARLLPPLAEKPVAGPVPAVVLRDGERRLAVVVDELLAEQEVVLRPLNHGKQHLPLLSGAALLGTGQVALVLNAQATITEGLGSAAGAGIRVAEPQPGGPTKRRILVVDDSITTRTLEQSILEAAGYDVLATVDGADGWRVLQEQGCDLVVADIEMPRMDGFALCEAIRSSSRFKRLPVVLVTALETAEHRTRGLEVGADAYIGKSSFDQQNLLDTIRQLLG
jgi:two-component system chemotaxis sensor kinase CheA